MEELRVGVVGLGVMGKQYAQIFPKLEGVKVVGIADTNPALASFAADLGQTFYNNADQLLDQSLDAVAICTPDRAHTQLCLEAINRKIAVMVEKPLAFTVQDAEAIAKAAADGNVLLMVGHICRFAPQWIAAKECIARGEIGEPIAITLKRVTGVGVQKNWLRGKTTLPMYLGVHDLDVARWLIGSEVVRVFSESRGGYLRSLGYEIEDYYLSTLCFANSVIGVSELGWTLPDADPKWESAGFSVTGTKGTIRVVQNENGTRKYTSEGVKSLYPYSFSDALVAELRHFVTCVMTGQKPSITAEDGLAAVRIAAAIEESAKSHSPVLIGS